MSFTFVNARMFKKFPLVSVMGLAVVLSACTEVESSEAEQTKGVDAQTSALSQAMTVYKSPTCGCCSDWITHAEQHGFSLTSEHPDDLAGLKTELGIGPKYRSCHTAVTQDGYVFEGHIPAKLVEQFLKAPVENAIGLSVPGMPAGSPGMEMGDRFSPYPVVVLMKDGTHQVYAMINQQDEQY
jgi:hypothetical protein